MTNGPTSDHIVEWVIKDCKWQGMAFDAFYNNTPANATPLAPQTPQITEVQTEWQLLNKQKPRE